ncbi:MAG TPA: excinuclease ABC subunit UvrA [Bryobacteraceae bacterium]|nr:excinuclease ABC subunit UvrA [Bryobacteraceae bacterium]
MSQRPTPEEIVVRGARLHNLKNLTLSIPHNKLTVITGVSGSGKSSLAFDTIYAEGQRRYVESLSAYARQFLERMEKPAVDEIDGIAPGIAIRQKNTTRNPRSTVATSTEIYDFMRLLWARAGRTFCPVCGRRVQKDTVDHVAQEMLAQPAGTRYYVLFPVKHEPAQVPKDRLAELRARGFNRLWQDGRVFEFSTPESLLDIDWTKPVSILADRLAIAPDARQRIVDTVEACYREAGEAVFEDATTGERRLFSERFVCKYDGIEFREPEPTLFSFNSPAGACPRCQGFGNTIDFSLDLIVPNRGLSLNQGAVEPWTKPKGQEWMDDFRKQVNGRVRFDVPFCDLTEDEQKLVLEGGRKVDGVRQFFNFLETKKYKLHVRVFLSRYRGYARCPDCAGSRLRKEALYVQVGGKTIAQAVRMNIAEAYRFFDQLELSPEETGIAGKILVEIQQRLKFLNDVGLEYLTLDRLSSTLSGGEAQRIQLATCLGSRLVGACYVLDEPSIGLHSRDTARLLRILAELRDIGNTIIVVEHDPDIMRAADHVIDLGPGAGEYGGNIIFEGNFPALMADRDASLTAKYLRNELQVARRKHRRLVDPKNAVRFYGAHVHNLKGVDVAIPLGVLTVITGVSGSGKSTLVHDVIYRSLEARLQAGAASRSEEDEISESSESLRMTCARMESAEKIKDVVMIDQTPIGRTPRSNPVTYIKAFDVIRGLFAATRDAEKRGYTAGHFSFNVPGGRCETCQGDGTVTVEMQFLADVELVCDECKGTRFKTAILDIRYKGLNIHEVLQLTVREAIGFFHDTPRLVSRLKLLDEVGLGYLRLGQSATTLSGGEAQRVKLAAHLAQATNEGTLFICDEPTTGLHFDDITKLLAAFERLIDNGGSLLVIEHNLDVIKAADWIIDMGPEGGEAGGRVVSEGTPEQIAEIEDSHTGRFLRQEITPPEIRLSPPPSVSRPRRAR